MHSLTSPRRGLTVGAALALQALVGGCADNATGPNDATNAHMVVSAAVAGTPIATLVVQVTGPGITQALAFNITAGNGFASGTIQIPPGVNRTITVKAFDSNGDITHEGSKLIELVRPGANPDVSVPMVPRPGQVEIDVIIGNILITLSTTDIALGGGGVANITATVTAANGDVLPVQVRWATTNPAAVTVNNAGQVVGVWEGTAQVVATYAGVAAAANVTVGACTITDYVFGTTISGNLDNSDCRRPPNTINSNINTLIDYYRASTTTQLTLEFAQDADFDTWLWEFDPNRNVVASNDDAVGLDSRFRVILAPGEYLIGASRFSTTSGSGPYTMGSVAHTAHNTNCDFYFFVTPGITTTQSLSDTDCGSGTYDNFRIAMRAGQTITVTMSSTAFNAALWVAGSFNDDMGSGSTNARVVYTSPSTGFVTIQPTRTGAGAGNYTLSVQ